jgi:hypothetical protein
VENLTGLNHAIKKIVRDSLNITPSVDYSKGKTLTSDIKFPNIYFKTATMEMQIADDAFEVLLSKNYLTGYDENLARIAREKEFMRKVKSRYVDLDRGEYNRLKNSLFSADVPVSKMYYFP